MSKMIAIVGPTASGKSALAMQIAAKYNGEIICADSRTIYSEMNIGTAKPSQADRRAIPHHLLDAASPDQVFTAAEFQRLAGIAVASIDERGKLPIIVGGTGLYVDSLLYDYKFPPRNPQLRADLSKLSLSQLQDKVSALGIVLNNSDYGNLPRLIRAIETADHPREKSALRPETLIIGLDIQRPALEGRIRRRTDQMVEDGFVAEVSTLIQKYGDTAPGLNGIGYRAFSGVAGGSQTVAAATEEFVRGDMDLAKRQMTWFKRNPDIQWASSAEYGLRLAENFLKEAII